MGVPTVAAVLGALLFALNGILLADGTLARITRGDAPAALPIGHSAKLRIVSYNIAKAFAHKGGLRFEPVEVVQARLEALADAIKSQRPDLVFVSEAIRENGLCPVDQVAGLAARLGKHFTAFGENYNFGLPFFRIVGGNGILSRWPLEPVVNMDLAGRKPFYITKNNRRALWCGLELNGSRLLLASVHNDSYTPATNLEQARQLVAYARSHGPALLAGDFNAQPGSSSLDVFRESGLFSGVWESAPTFPASHADQTIDFILAPSGWEVIEHKVIDSTASDHYPVLTVFRVP